MDVKITGWGTTLVQFHLLSPEARAFVNERVEAEPHQFLGDALCVEHRYATELAQGMVFEGLEVEGL